MRKISLLFITLLCFSHQYLISSINTIDLKGKWAFAMDEKEVGVTDKWFSYQLNDSIVLPGSMVENLK